MVATIVELSVRLVVNMFVIVGAAYLVTRTRYLQQIVQHQFTLLNRAVFILIFGALAIFATYAGIPVPGAIANVRDLGPMIAGLLGGPVIGLGAGLIGGVHRYFLGGLTGIPCSLATILAGLFGGLIYLRRDGTFIGVPGAVVFAALMESLHMGLILLLAEQYAEAVAVVKTISVPMVLANALGMLIFALIISHQLMTHEEGAPARGT
ncbi:MAG: LytS/YhcK type 5TM receptor domain-containing protein [Candidatus Methanospirareceae archaeon]